MRGDPVLDLWGANGIDSSELIVGMLPKLRATLPKPLFDAALVQQFHPIATLLDEYRRRSTFDGVGEFLTWVRRELERLYPNTFALVQRSRATRALREREYLERIEIAIAADTDRSTGPADPFILREPVSDGIRRAAQIELPRLGVFATLPDMITSELAPIARILSLRVFGGWTLDEIATRDGVEPSQVAAIWDAAKEWLAAHSGLTLAAPAAIVTLDLFDHHVLKVIRESPALLRSVNWRMFEKILAGVLEQIGYEIELRRGTKDGGIDIVAIKGDSPFGVHRYLIQAKRTDRAVGVEPVRELLFLKHQYGATKACLATTSTFTRGAWQLANEYRWELELRDFERVKEWLEMLA
ncbi:MAG: restriction endonuclease [Acidobacteriota bacterium]|nr:restriction endonuclease [Acidobacteriota bacterium]